MEYSGTESLRRRHYDPAYCSSENSKKSANILRAVACPRSAGIVPLTHNWIANIEVPIFKDGQPFRELAVIMRQEGFLRLLSAHAIPTNWLVGIIDGDGRFIARLPKGPTEVGQLASEGWRATEDRTGVFEYTSLEGDAVINANAHPSIGSWTVGVAVKNDRQIHASARHC